MKYLVLILIVSLLPLLPIFLNKVSAIMHHAMKQPSKEDKLKIAEAEDVLGLRHGATEEEIRAAHKRLIQANHPDSGGSQYLASKINEARDILLKNL